MNASAASSLRGLSFVFNQCSKNGTGRLASVSGSFVDRKQNITMHNSCSLPSRGYFKTASSSNVTTFNIAMTTTCRSHSRSNNFPERRSYTQAASTLTREQLHDLVYRLNEDERELLMNTLKQFESNKQKAQFEGQLAATVWRSRFGRPSRLKPVLGDVDPTGSYCAVPEDWLKKKSVEAMPPPPTRDLFQLGLVNALPFIGFGFLDNFTMIIAGDYIEHTLGLFMCISTMAAAALGNTISDVVGIGSAFYVEKVAELSGVRPPKLSPLQLEMKSSRRAANMGRVIGITIGCLLGMCPLMFMKDEDKDKDKGEDEAKDAKKSTDTAASSTQ